MKWVNEKLTGYIKSKDGMIIMEKVIETMEWIHNRIVEPPVYKSTEESVI